MSELYVEGLSDRQIAKRLGTTHYFVGKWRHENGLEPNRDARYKFQWFDHENGICSKCNAIKHMDEFLWNRKGKPYPYRMSYCLACRRLQLEKVLNSDVYKYLRDRYGKLKTRSKQKGVAFDLEFVDFKAIWDSQNGLCFYTDMPLRCQVGSGVAPNAFSVDKIIPALGYTKRNTVFCSYRINSMKRDMSLEEMQKWAPDWYARIKIHQDRWEDVDDLASVKMDELYKLEEKLNVKR